MSKLKSHSKTIQIPIVHREFPPSNEELQRRKKLEDEFDSIWDQNESPPETESSPIAPSAPSASILTMAGENYIVYNTGCFERVDENPASNFLVGDENFTVYSTGRFGNNDENPDDVEVNVEKTCEFPVSSQPKPVNVIPGENEKIYFVVLTITP